MGKGIKLARQIPGHELHAQVLDDFKDQLLIVLMKRLADKDGRVVIPVAETDNTAASSAMQQAGGFMAEITNVSAAG